MTSALDHVTTVLQTTSTSSPPKIKEGRGGAHFSQHLLPVPENARPAIFATLIDPRGADFLLKETERTAQHEAMQEFAAKSSANAEQMGAALSQMRQLFADMGVPIIDMVQMSRSPDGAFISLRL